NCGYPTPLLSKINGKSFWLFSPQFFVLLFSCKISVNKQIELLVQPRLLSLLFKIRDKYIVNLHSSRYRQHLFLYAAPLCAALTHPPVWFSKCLHDPESKDFVITQMNNNTPDANLNTISPSSSMMGHVACTVNLAKMVLIFPPMFWSSLVPMSSWDDFSILDNKINTFTNTVVEVQSITAWVIFFELRANSAPGRSFTAIIAFTCYDLQLYWLSRIVRATCYLSVKMSCYSIMFDHIDKLLFGTVTLYSHSPFLPITPFILLQTS
ncbi:hypothetical protein L9F63_004870, partial [Diploptera punctata]